MSFHLMTDDKGRSYIYVKNEDVKMHIPEDVIVLDLNPSMKRNRYTAFQNLPSNDENRLISSLISNKKIWFDDRMTGAYFYNFLAQSVSQLNRIK